MSYGRPPTLDNFLQQRAITKWRDKHHGISYEVAYWGHGPRGIGGEEGVRGTWNYYLLLPEAQWRPEDFAAMLCAEKDWGLPGGTPHKGWDYFASGLAELDWHGGITHYEVRGIVPERLIHAGCDFEHLWDREAGYPYSLSYVEMVAKSTIDDLLKRFTPLVRCRYSGRYAEPEAMVPTKWPDEFVLAELKPEIWPQWFEEVETA